MPLSFNVNQFRSNGLPTGGARPSLFEIVFPQNVGVPSEALVEANTSLVRCSGASIPMAQITSIDVYYFGRAERVPGERTFPPWQVRCYNEEDFGLRDFFESWSNQINSFVGNLAASNQMLGVNGGPKADQVIVRQYSRNGDLLRSYEFYGMYPEVVGEIELNWEQGNRIETFDVRFAYDYWTPGILDTTQDSAATYDVGAATTTSDLNANGVPNAGSLTPANPVSFSIQ